jgi:hypothetical protein
MLSPNFGNYGSKIIFLFTGVKRRQIINHKKAKELAIYRGVQVGNYFSFPDNYL